MEYEFLQSDLANLDREIPKLRKFVDWMAEENDQEPSTLEELERFRQKLEKLEAKRAETVAQLDFFEKGLAQSEAEESAKK
ncbi:hypothetical protein [Limnobacter sp.]|uniref:hypothetical protein n=1 Tax=Limnobacter sp. TaxID=2003368 RepID=UPI0027B99621|nr:hypothetical protein [Limnobacter sp.]